MTRGSRLRMSLPVGVAADTLALLLRVTVLPALVESSGKLQIARVRPSYLVTL